MLSPSGQSKWIGCTCTCEAVSAYESVGQVGTLGECVSVCESGHRVHHTH